MSATEQEAWDDWNRWGESVTQTPMIREAHRAAYRRALEDAASECYAMKRPESNWAGEYLSARAAAVAPRETKD